MPEYKGACHCGAVEWTAEVDEVHIPCHCYACKYVSGGEYTLNQIIPKDNLKITKGELKTYTYKGDSGNDTVCYFCGTCTANPYHHQKVLGPDKIVVRTVFLKGADKWDKVPAEVYAKDRWSFQPKIAAESFDVMPPS